MNDKLLQIQQCCEHFQIPACAGNLTSTLLSPDEIHLISIYSPEDSFTCEDLAAQGFLPETEIDSFLKGAYSRSVLNLNDATHYAVGSFYGRLGAFCQYESELWNSVPESERAEICDWYLNAFIERNTPLTSRADCVAPLDEVIQLLHKKNQDVYVTNCDCRSIFQRCKHSRETCISFSAGLNSAAHRGHARKLSMEDAIELVKTLDKEGLIHTLEGEYGICNCCGDCCFEYQAARKCDTIGLWPHTHTIAHYDTSDCIHCGLCARRCPMQAFEKEKKEIFFHPNSCIGCGVCVSACPRNCISLIERKESAANA